MSWITASFFSRFARCDDVIEIIASKKEKKKNSCWDDTQSRQTIQFFWKTTSTSSAHFFLLVLLYSTHPPGKTRKPTFCVKKSGDNNKKKILQQFSHKYLAKNSNSAKITFSGRTRNKVYQNCIYGFALVEMWRKEVNGKTNKPSFFFYTSL